MITRAQRTAARKHFRNQRRISVASLRAAVRAWRRLDMGAPDRSWFADGIGLALFGTVVRGKLLAAEQAEPYLDAMVGARDLGVGQPHVRPPAFADTAADGRPLDQLLFRPVVTARTAFLAGAAGPRAQKAGELALARIIQTEVADAGRQAVHSEMVTRPQVTGYIRMLNPPSCGRCAILAGRFYRWSDGFERHPNCDCTHVPTTERPDDEDLVDPTAAVRSGNVNGLSEADREAILAGAAPSQVINAHSGMYTADGTKFTRAGTTRHGLAGQRLQGARRLRPEAILRIADGDRQEALRLLYLHGYVI